uniref:Uncharacterized protein n=1 Tax=Phaeomonas parva TaxID=124430 RepID=A0A7S1U9R5_9STRA|mmetsp:Transcript_38264/g.120020  ORF Transcript_38264/g.120020 Transcript_38264/m.120020 type:complete len:305 (+) Transcript_38264:176-1090(+)|eukprot:CAMPEP_0118853626 /NCGR_PEP_ID=MMETSP1163-20130328/2144_1 /TAXON_ID=124430 /ORGANISM="Phaeomonas parva, Strain CCMP2877" /LENGTH=304 /DNA_ID=CAMNT_0006786209 /DNA_START=141 /DNA_END=1055 /DNA_ORIENTATION=-
MADWQYRAGGAQSLYNYHKTGKAPTKRFTTTTASGLKLVADRYDEVEPRQVIADRMRERKLANNTTSILFGSDCVDYQTDAMRRQKDILKAGGYDAEQIRRNREMKKSLTQTNFELGNVPTVYERTMRLPAPSSDLTQYTGVLNGEVQRFIKKSSLHFGDYEGPMESTAHLGMAESAASHAKAVNMREECSRLKQELQRNNFEFGTGEPTDYTTDYKSGYVDYTGKTGPRAELAKEVQDDLRKCHYELGTDTIDWTTDTMRQMATVPDHMDQARDPAEDRKRNFAIKQSLQITHYEIGTDREYE